MNRRLIGGMGMAPSADIGDRHAVFQPATAPRPISWGRGKAKTHRAESSPLRLMLDWLATTRPRKRGEAGERIERAVDKVYADLA